ncbi:unnamed protein product [Blepharisma stoltei]|uniref:Uncharacterized protein n=1 Tax=Blepharisma stoltei TaxID=1481888 RepID=A0AAU9KCC2_9CILI|nr:unnamed protein product [Blepharisma stoltei]
MMMHREYRRDDEKYRGIIISEETLNILRMCCKILVSRLIKTHWRMSWHGCLVIFLRSNLWFSCDKL